MDEYCQKNSIDKISVSSIARIIKELKNKGLINNGVKLKVNGATVNITEHKKPINKGSLIFRERGNA